jgi:hypothetical protein
MYVMINKGIYDPTIDAFAAAAAAAAAPDALSRDV